MNWTVEDWKRVIWSDETKINFVGSDGKQLYWLKTAGFNPKQVKGTVKYGGSSIMIWGCTSWEGIGGMWLVIGRMNSHQYIEILQDKLTPTMSDMQHKYTYSKIIFQQDNDPKHTAKQTKQ